MKDNFSKQSDDYARFRPDYPQELISYILSLCENRDVCWDCGTGNGQLAGQLSEHFQSIEATDISERQLSNAVQKSNITYSLQSAEQTNFSIHQFDLITVGQAAHWFDHAKFNEEVKRILKPNGVIVLIGYGLVKVKDPIGSIISEFYWNVTHPYWDPERDHIEAKYETIPFPYEEVKDVPEFVFNREMKLKDLLGYISTWSAVQHYTKQNGASPMSILEDNLSQHDMEEELTVTFPLFTRIGRVN